MKHSPETVEPRKWYDKGVHFSCTRCGNCCTGPSGFVWFNDDELKQMAQFTGVSPESFIRRHARKINGRWSLNERKGAHGYDCVFLTRDKEGKSGCAIYPVRPAQCRTWPFWPENMRSRENWERAGQRCPGMARGLHGEGQFYPIEEIRIRLGQNDNV